jgi:hypothetical protein
MIKYEYTESNRLSSPHKYMYTKYEGKEFINVYIEDRKSHIERFKNVKNSSPLDKNLYLSTEFFLRKGELLQMNNYLDIDIYSGKNEIKTDELLLCIIANHLNLGFNEESLLKNWTDFFVQRFEVTKKIFESYHSKEFRVGKGKNDSARLYGLLALLLTLNFSITRNLKYLSTLLKLNDLLCSLDDTQLDDIPSEGLTFIMSKELEFINSIYKNKTGIGYAS